MPRPNRRKSRDWSRVKPAPVYPFPEVLDSKKPWTIRGVKSGPYYVEQVRKEMRIPVGEDLRERQIRNHEMTHVRHSPKNPATWEVEGVDELTVNAAEDARITIKMQEAGIPVKIPYMREADYIQFQQGVKENRFTPLDMAGMIMASEGTPDYYRLVQILEDAGYGAIAPLVDGIYAKHFSGRRPPFDNTREAARELHEVFGFDKEEDEDEEREVMDGLNDMTSIEYNESDHGEGPVWGDMQIVEPKMPLRIPARMRVPKRRARQYGAVPRNWHRLPIDQAVFDRRMKQVGGGTVLIDQSGSMSLTPNDVLNIMANLPGVTIAGYAGWGSGGELRMLARNGRRVKDEDVHIPHSGNIVDGPALDWLGNQPGPRYWVSDGWVTGKHESQTPSILRDAMAKVFRYRIRRVPKVDALTEQFS